MSLSLYDVSIPLYLRAFNNISAFLKKGEAFADEKGIAHEKFLQGQLHSDQKGLVFQIQRVTDTAKFCAVRVAGIENEVWADDEYGSIPDEQPPRLTRAKANI